MPAFLAAAGVLLCSALARGAVPIIWLSLALCLVLALWARDARRMVIAAKWSLPFALPLLAVHGILNANYPVTQRWGIVPLREQGIEFGLVTGLRLWIFAMAIAFLSSVGAQQLLAYLYALRWVPKPLVVLIASAVSMFHYLSERAASMSLAQRSRGLARGPGIRPRIGSLLAVVVPLVAVVIVESRIRGLALGARGMGTRALRLDPVAPPCWRDWAGLAVAVVLCLSTIAVSWT
jgi:energy-coupling factor transporter transmembrane protein EcfT